MFKHCFMFQCVGKKKALLWLVDHFKNMYKSSKKSSKVLDICS